MKTINLLTLTVVTGSLLGFTSQAGIVGSKHDFSQWSFNNNPADPNTVCSVCHTPHHADANSGPLWGHDSVSASPAYWTMYAANVGPGVKSSPGASVKYVVPSAPNPSSLACLSCHDGSVAINAYGDPAAPNGAPNRANPVSLSGVYAISEQSGNLSHSHPISFNYQSVVGVGNDQFIWPQDNAVLQPLPGSSSTFTPGSVMTIKGFLLDSSGNLECSSCHDVHGQLGSAYDPLLNPSLLKINGTAPNTINGNPTGSLLCRSCHNK